MSTPNFKLLANALRLGQPPPDPLLAFRVLVEVIQHQESEIAELRQRVSMLTSRLQFTEAKAARVEAATLGDAPIAPAPAAPPARTPTFGPPPPHPGEQTGSQAASPPATSPPAEVAPVRAAPAHGMQIPKMPPIPKEAKKRVDPHPELAPIDDSDVTLGTLVVARADIDAVVKNVSENEAPFPLSPPGGHRPPSHEGVGMPFKAARPLDPTGGTLKGVAPKTPSKPPPPGVPAIPTAPAFPPAPRIPAARNPAPAPAAPPPAAAAPAPRVRVGPVLPPRGTKPRPEPSAPYIAIEDMPMDDTFSSTSQDLAAVQPPAVKDDRPGAASSGLLDDGSFDDSAMTILTRRPHGQER